jgi:hypothetical protein
LSYNTTIPAANSKRAISQRQILINFQSIFQAFANNHSALGLGTQGKHRVLILKDQTLAGDPATSPTQIAIYQKIIGGNPSWFYRPISNGTPIQMSYQSVKTGLLSTNPDVYFSDQYSFIAGPFVVYAGKVTNPSNNQLVTLLPSTTLRYVGLTVTNYKFTGTGTPAAIAVAIPTSVSGNTFKISYQTRPAGLTYDVYYVAIGN